MTADGSPLRPSAQEHRSPKWAESLRAACRGGAVDVTASARSCGEVAGDPDAPSAERAGADERMRALETPTTAPVDPNTLDPARRHS